MTPDILLTMLRTAPDPTQEIIWLVQSSQFNPRKPTPTRDAAYNLRRGAILNAARDVDRTNVWAAARNAAWDAAVARNTHVAWDASLLAGVMVVQDLIPREHLDFALENFCYWMEE